MSVDSWAALQHLDWAFYGSLYTVAVSRADVSSGQLLAPAVIHRLREDSDLRLCIQKELYYGLSRWWWSNGRPCWPQSESLTHCRGALDMAPWVALIGMRLPGYLNREAVDRAGSTDLRRVRILTLLLELPYLCTESPYDPQKEGAFWAEHVAVGQVLDQCYHQGLLETPNSSNLSVCRKHVSEIVHAMALMNLWHLINRYSPPSNNSVDEIRCMKMSELCEYIHDDEEYGHQPPSSQEFSFQSREMSLELLRKVGKLKIEWTEFLDEHLDLNVEDLTLKIFWFGFSIKANPIYQYVSSLNQTLFSDNSLINDSAVWDAKE